MNIDNSSFYSTNDSINWRQEPEPRSAFRAEEMNKNKRRKRYAPKTMSSLLAREKAVVESVDRFYQKSLQNLNEMSLHNQTMLKNIKKRQESL